MVVSHTNPSCSLASSPAVRGANTPPSSSTCPSPARGAKLWTTSRFNLALSIVIRYAPRRHSRPMTKPPFQRSPTPSCSARPLTALGAVEDHPRAEVVREVLEAMFYPGRHEENVASGEEVMTIPVDEGAAAPRHHVQLVPGVGSLLIGPARGVVLHYHGPVRQDLDGALASRHAKGRSLLYSHPPPLGLRMRFVQRSSSSLFVLTTHSDLSRAEPPACSGGGGRHTSVPCDEPAQPGIRPSLGVALSTPNITARCNASR